MTNFDDTADRWTIAIDADTSGLQSELRAAASLGRQFGSALTAAFEGIAIKGRSVSDVLRGLTLRLSELVLKAALRPLEQGFGNFLGSLFSGGLGFANGGVFQQGLPVPFAHGGVIQSPIAFPLQAGRVGIAGERGAEAILPLARGPDGRLGVVSAGGGGGPHITINVSATDVESFRRSEAQIGALLVRTMALGQRNM